MVAPIEEPLSDQIELFDNGNPQQEALGATGYESFLNAMYSLQCTCCRVGPTNGGAPPVVETGNARGRIVLIGEAPGKKERELGMPFQGPAGAQLATFLVNAGIPERACYITNVLKCRPFDQIVNKENVTEITLKDRPPSEDECKACMPLLRKQMTFMRPTYIVLLGKTAVASCLGMRPGFSIIDMIGCGIPLRVCNNKALALLVPHPSYFLHKRGAEVQASRTLEVFRSINLALTSGRPMTFQLIPEDMFLARNKPLYYEKKAMVCA